MGRKKSPFDFELSAIPEKDRNWWLISSEAHSFKATWQGYMIYTQKGEARLVVVH